MRIYKDDRTHFYQWDLNRKLTADGLAEGDKIHFVNAASAVALVVRAYALEDGTVVADVPNPLLCVSLPITAYRYVKQDAETFTKEERTFPVQRRQRPADYIYTETQVHSIEALEAEVAKKTTVTIGGESQLTFAVDEYVAIALARLVNSSPETLDTLGEIAKALGDDPNFATTMTEMIGKKLDREDLVDYVKFTDIAKNKLGVVKIGDYGTHGINISSDSGLITTAKASEQNIKDRFSDYKPIVPTMLDIAVKEGVVNNGQPLTDEEKARACEWLGALKLYKHFITLTYDGYGSYGQQIGFDVQGEVISSSAEPLTGKAAPANTMLHGLYAGDSTSPDGVGSNWVSAWGIVFDSGKIQLRAITAISPNHEMYDDNCTEVFDASANIITHDIVTEV